MPTKINHQGVVSVNGQRFNGTGNFYFAIVDPGSGNSVWTNDGTSVGTLNRPDQPVTVACVNGLYSVLLGDTALTNMTPVAVDVFSAADRALRIWFDDGTDGVHQLLPDHPLTTTPYAFRVTDNGSAGARFGGTGVDGSLNISSGTVNINLGGAPMYRKNYASISITGSAALTFSNPSANGTIVVLKSLGDVTITSSNSPAIDGRSMGGASGTGGSFGFNGSSGSYGIGSPARSGFGARGTESYTSPTGGAGGSSLGAAAIFVRNVTISCGGGGGGGGGSSVGGSSRGSGGGGGGAVGTPGTAGGDVGPVAGALDGNGGNGGRGGGALYIECGGLLNLTGAISVAGMAGSPASGGNAGGGGGGGGGTIFVLYNSLTADSGTYLITGGVQGAAAGNGGGGGTGGDGIAVIARNTEFP